LGVKIRVQEAGCRRGKVRGARLKVKGERRQEGRYEI
jgi:hypothetical protein